MKKNHKSKEFEFDEVVTGRKRVIAMSILQGAKTPEEIAAVARSIGEGTLGNDAIVLKVMSDYWAADASVNLSDSGWDGDESIHESIHGEPGWYDD